jgi:hypothetical protein
LGNDSDGARSAAGNVKAGTHNVLIDSYEVGTQNWTRL